MRRCVLLILLLLVSPAYALERGENDVLVRVVDVGAGLCCVAVLPDADEDEEPEYVIYDAGFGSTKTINKIKELVPEGSHVELMVLSHSDADHLSAVENICETYQVRTVLRTGFARNTDVWKDAYAAIRKEVRSDGCLDINLAGAGYPRGSVMPFGDAFIQFVAGWDEPPAEFDLGTERDDAEYRNSVSIVIKLAYDGKSVLFTGDTIGREIDAENEEEAFKAAEKDMVRWNAVIPLKSTVMIAPHHGADNASSAPFIEAVDPTFVIFSAGNQFDHPRLATAQRYLDHGVLEENMYRTDRGAVRILTDNEWDGGHRGVVDPVQDKSGDDDVDILLPLEGAVVVDYRE